MLTRGEITHTYYPAPVKRLVRNGVVRVTMGTKGNSGGKNIPQTWAISRPSTSPDPNGAPYYLVGDRNYDLLRGGVFPLSLRQPRKEMDPSNPDTWQRRYVFD